ncbi:hypothetical protein BH23VER1_BH23VER1_24460 [soil metagenome]
MPSYSLDELAAARIEVISFFVVVFLLCSFVVRWAWNSLAEVVGSMPAIRFKHALCLMLLSGLFLYVVLTMVSGARELMTPGAWNKVGLTYQLAIPRKHPSPPEESARRLALENLHSMLVAYAQANGGAFPTNQEESGFDPERWRGPDPAFEPFSYSGWLTTDSPPGRIIAFEGADYGEERMALTVAGAVIALDEDALADRLRREFDAVAGQVQAAEDSE